MDRTGTVLLNNVLNALVVAVVAMAVLPLIAWAAWLRTYFTRTNASRPAKMAPTTTMECASYANLVAANAAMPLYAVHAPRMHS